MSRLLFLKKYNYYLISSGPYPEIKNRRRKNFLRLKIAIKTKEIVDEKNLLINKFHCAVIQLKFDFFY